MVAKEGGARAYGPLQIHRGLVAARLRTSPGFSESTHRPRKRKHQPSLHSASGRQ